MVLLYGILSSFLSFDAFLIFFSAGLFNLAYCCNRWKFLIALLSFNFDVGGPISYALIGVALDATEELPRM